MFKVEYSTVAKFLDWTKRKIGLLHTDKDVYFDERDIWWASIGENIGSEENGKNDNFERPVIILKKVSKDLFIAVPTSTRIKAGTWYKTFDLYGEKRCALLVQIRALSRKRLIRKLGSISSPDFESIKEAAITLIKTDPSAGAVGSSDPLTRTM